MRRAFYEFYTSDEIAAGRSRCWRESAPCMQSKRKSADIPPNIASRCARHEVDRSSKPCMTWLQDHVGRVSGVSDLAKAMRYAIRHWPGLVAFLDDGRVEMDTNVVERAIRPHTLTRKNALFAGSDGGARHWAIAMTLIQTAKLNGVDPMAWLTDVLERVVSGRTKANALDSCCHGTGCQARRSRAHPRLHSRSIRSCRATQCVGVTPLTSQPR